MKIIKWHAKMGDSHQGLVIDEDTGRNVAVAYDKADTPLLAAAPRLKAVLAEFVADVEAVGPRQVGKEWPDLLVTYNKAKSALGEIA